MIGLVDAGTASVGSTELLLTKFDEPGVYAVQADATALAGGETLTIRTYGRITAGDFQSRLYKSGTIAGAAPVDPAILDLGPIITAGRLRVTAQNSAAGPRSIPWRVYRVGRYGDVKEGSQVCTVGTEHTLVTITYGGVFALVTNSFDLLQVGDTFELRLKTRSGAGGAGTTRTVKYLTASGVQTQQMVDLGPVPVSDLCVATMKQTAGVSRTLGWSLVQLAV